MWLWLLRVYWTINGCTYIFCKKFFGLTGLTFDESSKFSLRDGPNSDKSDSIFKVKSLSEYIQWLTVWPLSVFLCQKTGSKQQGDSDSINMMEQQRVRHCIVLENGWKSACPSIHALLIRARADKYLDYCRLIWPPEGWFHVKKAGSSVALPSVKATKQWDKKSFSWIT